MVTTITVNTTIKVGETEKEEDKKKKIRRKGNNIIL
jgi:hypothetical protein